MDDVTLYSFTSNMTDAEVLEWLVEDGDSVEVGQGIVEVESEKAAQVIPAPAAGEITIVAEEGQQVDVGEVLARIETAGGRAGSTDAGEPSKAIVSTDGPSGSDSPLVDGSGDGADGTQAPPAAGSGTAAGASARTGADGVVRASPAARRLAREENLELSKLADGEGSGPEGALIQRDVRAALSSAPFADGADTASGRRISERREGSQLRQAVADQMSASARDAPQVTLNRSASVDDLLGLKTDLETDLGWTLSLTDFVMAAVAEANQRNPAFNAIYENGTLQLAENVNIGLAVDLEGGLVTPVIRNVDRRSLKEISQARERVVRKTSDRDYTHEDLADGTFTITNLGHFGVESFDPLLNVPEVAILGVGSVVERPIKADSGDDVRFESQLGLSLTFDHRPIDGADAARYLDTLTGIIEHPLRIVARDTQARGGRAE